MFEVCLLSVILGLLIYYYYYQSSTRGQNYPPGPLSLPLIGAILNEAIRKSSNPVQIFYKLGKIYGPVVSVKIGSVDYVILSSYEAIKEVETNFIERADDILIRNRTGGKRIGLIFGSEEIWSETRKFTHRVLRDSGFGKSLIMEQIFSQKLVEFSDQLNEKIQNSPDGSIIFKREFNILFLNFSWALITGENLSLKDPQVAEMSKASQELVQKGCFCEGLPSMYPWLLEYFPKIFGFNKFHTLQMNFKEKVAKIIKQHREEGNYKTNPQCLVDSFLYKIEIDGNSNKNIFNDENMSATLEDLIMAANDTQSNTMRLALRFMVQFPHVQEKIRDEIDKVIGKSQNISISDCSELKYLQATLLEIFRITSIVPFLPRKAYRNSKLWNYGIKKGTILVAMYYAYHMDENAWENPTEFHPERFIDENNKIVNIEKVLAFGIGKRNCIGESVARKSLIFVLSHLVQNFIFEVDPKWGVPNNDYIENFSRDAPNFSIIIKKRT